MSDDVALLLGLLQGHLYLTKCVLCYWIKWAHSVAICLGLLGVCKLGICTAEGLESPRQMIRFLSLSAWTNFSVEKEAKSVKMYWIPCFRKMAWSTHFWMTQTYSHAAKRTDRGRENALSWFHMQLDSWQEFLFFFFLQLWPFVSLPSSCSWTLVLEVKVQVWHAGVSNGTFSSASHLKKLHDDLF